MWERRLRAIEEAKERKRQAEAEAGNTEESEEAAEAEAEAPKEIEWDPPRVARAFARIVRVAAHSIRRARFLCRLSESTLVWRDSSENGDRRMLVFAGGAIVKRGTVGATETAKTPPGHAVSARQRLRSFDVATYDRMRVLGTELKRLVGDSQGVELRLEPARLMSQEVLARALRWI